MKIRCITLTLLILAAVAFQAAGQTSTTTWLNGTWTGAGDQRSAGKGTWSMKLTYDAAKNIAAVDYASLSCKSTWKMLEGNALKAVFVETLSTGKQTCTEGLSVVVTKVNAGSVKVAFFNPGDNVNDASKTLTSLILTKT